LNSDELREWTNKEIHGYGKDDSLPDYRILTCSVIGDVSNGVKRMKNTPLPVFHFDEGIKEKLQTARISQSIASLEMFVKKEDSDKMEIPIPPEFFEKFNEALEGSWVERARMVIDKAQVTDLLTEIKSKLLDFVLGLKHEVGDSKIDASNNPGIKDVVKDIFNSTVIGDNATITIGHGNSINITNEVSKGDFSSVERALQEYNVPEEDIQELREIIDEDNVDFTNKKLGDQVKEWLSNLAGKAIKLGWEVSLSQGLGAIEQAILAYYGMA
ncbi:MAG: hypothetical protein ABEH43_05425, partial [Flavobacteriales bacterium]